MMTAHNLAMMKKDNSTMKNKFNPWFCNI
jgi:hypothetical protein